MSPNFYASGARIADRYEVAGRPLVGGMGVVYLCFDHQEQRPVALKTFKPEFLPDRAARERFLREGTTWVALGRHPHVVHAYGVERIGDGREVYLVLELVAKEQGRVDAALRSYLIPGRPLSVVQALGFALQIARGMLHASATLDGFVHRDLKPENVLVGADRLMGSDLNGVRVTDFGLVRAATVGQADTASENAALSGTRAGLTQVGGVLGTPPYMAPEQWENAQVDARADIYALGCILGEMLIGRRLVQATTLASYQQAHQEGHALQAVAGLPAEVQDVLKLCLAVAPGIRYGSWVAVTQALAALYTQVTGRVLPESGSTSVLSRGERVAVGWSYSAIGGSYLDLGQAARALGFFTQVLQIGRAESDRQLEAAGMTGLGLAYANLGDVRRAIGSYEQALAIDREIGNRRSEGADLGNLGIVYKNLGDFPKAISYQEQALVVSREIGDRRLEGNTLRNLGVAHKNLGDFQKAIDCQEQALVISREIGDRQIEGDSLNDIGVAYRNLGDARRAIKNLEQSLVIYLELGDRRFEGKTLGNLGNAYSQLGDNERAIGYHEQALTISRETDDRMGEGAALGSLGNAYRNLGDVRRAIDYYEQTVNIYREIGDANGVAASSFNMALVYDEQGDPARALPMAREAAHIWSQIGHAANAEHARQLVAQLERQGG